MDILQLVLKWMLILEKARDVFKDIKLYLLDIYLEYFSEGDVLGLISKRVI